ncbi:MAG: septal ring lytic transglycosylase RlpA family protein [Nitrospirota bacterium]|nr:septal ring lytic transglycosylase RlpA family protein [Nitrospirota bacterium]
MKRFVIIIALIFLSSCATGQKAGHVPPAGGEYVTASWYGQDFHGRPTSCGERYDMYGLTAAHKTMKFGTRLRVTNPDNNKSADVTVNDRGPFIPGRDLDLSYGAAKAIGMEIKGVGRVKIEYLDRDMRYVKRLPYEPVKPSAPEGAYTIQAGSFIEQDNALRLKQGLLLSYNDVFITTADINGQKFFRVRVGRFNTYDSAYSVAQKLADEGYSTFITARN